MKVLVIGPQLSGKTTLVRYLRNNADTPVSEIDEEILKANKGVWPDSNKYKDDVLVPRIYESLLLKENMIFFANYFAPISILKRFKESGYKIIMIQAPRDVLLARNTTRMEDQGYDDASPWLDGQLANHKKIVKAGLTDIVIDATLTTDDIAKQILA